MLNVPTKITIRVFTLTCLVRMLNLSSKLFLHIYIYFGIFL